MNPSFIVSVANAIIGRRNLPAVPRTEAERLVQDLYCTFAQVLDTLGRPTRHIMDSAAPIGELTPNDCIQPDEETARSFSTFSTAPDMKSTEVLYFMLFDLIYNPEIPPNTQYTHEVCIVFPVFVEMLDAISAAGITADVIRSISSRF